MPRSKQLRNIIDDENQKRPRRQEKRRGGDRPRHMPPNEFGHYNPRQPRGRDDFEMDRPPPHMRDG
jgi:hypothetical protein